MSGPGRDIASYALRSNEGRVETSVASGQCRHRILLADDSSDNLFLFGSYLKRLPVEVDKAEDGSMALQKFGRYPYDLVLMDVHMPIMDGLTAIRHMREVEARTRRRRTPIVALTASIFGKDVETCMAAGADMYVAKPIKRGALLEVVSNLLECVCPILS
jgi:CheY-like chemotaxis protein